MQFSVAAFASVLALAGSAIAQVPQGVDPNTLPKSILSLTLKGGKLYDAIGRTGYIAANYQFQFDDPPQPDYIVDQGFSVCNGNLALRGSPIFYSCDSGDFSNLYDRKWAEQCEPVNIQVVPESSTTSTGSTASTSFFSSVPSSRPSGYSSRS